MTQKNISTGRTRAIRPPRWSSSTPESRRPYRPAVSVSAADRQRLGDTGVVPVSHKSTPSTRPSYCGEEIGRDPGRGVEVAADAILVPESAVTLVSGSDVCMASVSSTFLSLCTEGVPCDPEEGRKEQLGVIILPESAVAFVSGLTLGAEGVVGAEAHTSHPESIRVMPAPGRMVSDSSDGESLILPPSALTVDGRPEAMTFQALRGCPMAAATAMTAAAHFPPQHFLPSAPPL